MTLVKWGNCSFKVNWLFLILMVLFGLIGELPRAAAAFTAVFFHEMGHVIVARFYGLQIQRIELMPFGGVAIFDDCPEVRPEIEWRVALAGPLVNLGLILITMLLSRYGLLGLELALFFITYNLNIGLFNLLPALPLDGGRIFRSLLVPYRGYWRATHQILQLTRGLALVVGLLAFLSWLVNRAGLLSLLGAFFVYFAALKEEEQSIYIVLKYLGRKKEQLQKEGFFPTETYLVLGETMVFRLVKLVSPGAFARFHVYNREDCFLGILTEIEVIEIYFHQGRNISAQELISSK